MVEIVTPALPVKEDNTEVKDEFHYPIVIVTEHKMHTVKFLELIIAKLGC